MASLIPDLPLWAWNLVIAMQHHEDLHAKSDPCLNGVLNNVPADVRNQAAAISSYVQKASGDQLADQVSKTFGDVLGSFFGTGGPEPAAGDTESTP
ncbi:hypothetical protein ACGFZC_01070 [[Kitasatospora] papulosa]|uniref:hypothetical protein n=1 Tax=[Kitasatospora] papulosa TaxID=1464011 RepID=UPI0037197EAD